MSEELMVKVLTHFEREDIDLLKKNGYIVYDFESVTKDVYQKYHVLKSFAMMRILTNGVTTYRPGDKFWGGLL